jgi:hypothetical protein
MDVYQKYDYREIDLDIRTGIRYNDAIIFDLIEYSIAWSGFESETDCKYFIQGKISDKGISIGDFNKAMLKIVTISKEWIKVFEEIGEVSTVHKLVQIEGLILKYGKGSTIRRRCDEADFIAVGDLLMEARTQKVGIETNNWINK